MNKSKDRLGKFTNLSLRIKLPGLITLLVIASVLAISVSVYSLGSELLLKKVKTRLPPTLTGSGKAYGLPCSCRRRPLT